MKKSKDSICTHNNKVGISFRTTEDKKNRLVKIAESRNISLTELILSAVDQTVTKDNQVVRKQLAGLIRNQKNFADLFDKIQKGASKKDLMEAANKILSEEVHIWHP